MDNSEKVHNPSKLFISFFLTKQTLRSSDKHWNSKLPYLQNPVLCQRAWWNSWEWLFRFHWKSLQCRALQNTRLPVRNTRSCKSLRELSANETSPVPSLCWSYCSVYYGHLKAKWNSVLMFYLFQPDGLKYKETRSLGNHNPLAESIRDQGCFLIGLNGHLGFSSHTLTNCSFKANFVGLFFIIKIFRSSLTI